MFIENDLNGKLLVCIGVPVCAIVGGSSHFTWGPDGEYASSVDTMAILFIVFSAVNQQVSLPEWLVHEQLAKTPACL